jgi:hypothetical protein
VHFLLLGGLVYFFYSLNAGHEAKPIQQTKQRIILHKNEINELIHGYEIEFHKKPNKEMLAALIQKAIEKKILLQEAYGLQLYKNDKEIENILLRKMHFIINAASAQTQPNETQLKAYYKENIKDYSKRKNITFCTIHFDTLSKKAQKDFYQLLQTSADITVCKRENKLTKKQIEQKYGNYLTNKIFRTKKDKWLPALPSKNGLDFVYIIGYETLSPYPFEEVEDRVLKDYQTQYKKQNHKKMLSQMQSTYVIKVQK